MKIHSLMNSGPSRSHIATCQGKTMIRSSTTPRLIDRSAAVCSLANAPEAENLSAAEKMAVEFADRFATDHLSIDGAFHERMREFFTDAQIVQLGFNCAFNSGFGRLFATWRNTAGTPEGARPDADGRIRPWTSPSVIFPDAALGTGD